MRSFVCFSAHGALGSMDVPRRGQAINTQEELQYANWVAAILNPCPYAEQLPAFSHASTSSRLVTFVPWIPVGSHPLAFLASRHTSKRSSETRLQLHHERCFPFTTQFDKSTDQACSVLRGPVCATLQGARPASELPQQAQRRGCLDFFVTRVLRQRNRIESPQAVLSNGGSCGRASAKLSSSPRRNCAAASRRDACLGMGSASDSEAVAETTCGSGRRSSSVELCSSLLPGQDAPGYSFSSELQGRDRVPKPGGNAGASGAWLPTLFGCNCWTMQGPCTPFLPRL